MVLTKIAQILQSPSKSFKIAPASSCVYGISASKPQQHVPRRKKVDCPHCSATSRLWYTPEISHCYGSHGPLNEGLPIWPGTGQENGGQSWRVETSNTKKNTAVVLIPPDIFPDRLIFSIQTSFCHPAVPDWIFPKDGIDSTSATSWGSGFLLKWRHSLCGKSHTPMHFSGCASW